MNKLPVSKAFWLAALRREATAFRAAAAEGDLAAPVPPCPGWSMLDLVHHLGSVYTWVAGHAGRGVTERADRWQKPAGLPTGEAGLAWWDERTAALTALLDGLDPALPAWNWAPQPKQAVFWHRRMAQETAVHRWDAQTSVGLPEPVDPLLAADGVAEVLDSWLPAGRRKGPADRTGVVLLDATDAEAGWTVRIRGEGISLLDTDTLLDDEELVPQVRASGTASDILLALWGRVPFDVLDVHGDPALLETLRTG